MSQHVSAISQQFRSCQSESSCYYLVLRQPDLVGDEQAGLTFPCQQWDIAPSFSRLHGISSRATVRRNAGEPFLLVCHCSRAATPARFLPSLRGSALYRMSGKAGQTEKRRKNNS